MTTTESSSPSDLLLPEATSGAAAQSEPDARNGSVERGWGRTPAHAILPADVSSDELDLATAGAALALARVGDRNSQEAAHARPEDLNDSTGTDAAARTESYDEGRRRRDSADLDAVSAQVRGDTRSVADDAASD